MMFPANESSIVAIVIGDICTNLGIGNGGLHGKMHEGVLFSCFFFNPDCFMTIAVKLPSNHGWGVSQPWLQKQKWGFPTADCFSSKWARNKMVSVPHL